MAVLFPPGFTSATVRPWYAVDDDDAVAELWPGDAPAPVDARAIDPLAIQAACIGHAWALGERVRASVPREDPTRISVLIESERLDGAAVRAARARPGSPGEAPSLGAYRDPSHPLGELGEALEAFGLTTVRDRAPGVLFTRDPVPASLARAASARPGVHVVPELPRFERDLYREKWRALAIYGAHRQPDTTYSVVHVPSRPLRAAHFTEPLRRALSSIRVRGHFATVLSFDTARDRR